MCIMEKKNLIFDFMYSFLRCQKHVLHRGRWTMCSANVIVIVNYRCWLNIRGAVTAISGRLFLEMSWYGCYMYFNLATISWNLKKNIKIN